MEPSYKLNDFDAAYVMEILTGISVKESSAALKYFASQGVSATSGKIPYVPSKYTLLSESSRKTKIAVDDEPETYPMESNSVEFRFDGKYSEAATVHETTVEGMGDQIKDEADLVTYLGSTAMSLIGTKFDLDFKEVLASTTLNGTVAAAAAWSGGSAEIFADMDKAVDKAGQPDFCWVGLDKAREMAADAGFQQAADMNFASTKGRLPHRAVAEILMTRYEFEDVIIDGRWYNTANEAQTISKSRVFDGFVTVGYRDHIIIPSLDNLEKANSWYKDTSGKYGPWAQMYLDIARAEQDRVVTITGT